MEVEGDGAILAFVLDGGAARILECHLCPGSEFPCRFRQRDPLLSLRTEQEDFDLLAVRRGPQPCVEDLAFVHDE